MKVLGLIVILILIVIERKGSRRKKLCLTGPFFSKRHHFYAA